MESLNLRANDLRRAVPALCAAIEVNTTLYDLNIRETRLDSNSLVSIAHSLNISYSHNLISTLKVLNISGNDLCYPNLNGIMKLKDTLSSSACCLEDLSLADCGLTSEAAVALAEFLPLNKKLVRLDISKNPIDIAGVLALSVSMKLNDQIVSLEILPVIEESNHKVHIVLL